MVLLLSVAVILAPLGCGLGRPLAVELFVSLFNRLASYKCPCPLEIQRFNPSSMSDSELNVHSQNPLRRLRDDALQLGPRKKAYVEITLNPFSFS